VVRSRLAAVARHRPASHIGVFPRQDGVGFARWRVEIGYSVGA